MSGQECSDRHPCGDDVDAGDDPEEQSESEYDEELTPPRILLPLHIPVDGPGCPYDRSDEFVEREYEAENCEHEHSERDSDDREHKEYRDYRHEHEEGDPRKETVPWGGFDYVRSFANIFSHKGVQNESEYGQKQDLEENVGEDESEHLGAGILEAFLIDGHFGKLLSPGDNALQSRVCLEAFVDEISPNLRPAADDDFLRGDIRVFVDDAVQIDLSAHYLRLAPYGSVEIDIPASHNKIFPDYHILLDVDIPASEDHIASDGTVMNADISARGSDIVPDISAQVDTSSGSHDTLRNASFTRNISPCHDEIPGNGALNRYPAASGIEVVRDGRGNVQCFSALCREGESERWDRQNECHRKYA